MGKVLEFKRPDSKRNWRNLQGKPRDDYTVMPSGASVNNKSFGAFMDLPEGSQELSPPTTVPDGYVVTSHPKVFEQVREAIGSRNQYSAFLEILTKREKPVRANKVSSKISWFVVQGEDDPTASLLMCYDTNHEVLFEFIGGNERRQEDVPRIGKTPVIDVATDIWVRVDPFLILTLQDLLETMNGISPILLLQDKTALRYSVIFAGYTKGRINVTITPRKKE